MNTSKRVVNGSMPSIRIVTVNAVAISMIMAAAAHDLVSSVSWAGNLYRTGKIVPV